MKIYVVTFDTQHTRDRRTKHYVYHCEAQNAKEAVGLAKEAWPRLFGENPRIPHQFHLHAVKSRIQDPLFLRVVSWAELILNGRDCLNEIVCTGWTFWPR